MKILHVANFSWLNNASVYYAIDRKISNGLIRNGHFVYDFSYRDIARHLSWMKRKKLGKKAMNIALLKTIQMLEPELILFGHSELVSVETIQKIKEEHPNIKMGLWWVDWLEKVKTIKDRLPYLDAVFTTTGVSESNKIFLSNKTTIAYIPNICDSSIDTYSAFNSKTVYDIFYAGRFDTERQEIVNNIKKLSKNYNIGLFGLSKDSILLGSKFIEAIGTSKCAINYSRNNQIPLYSSDRIIQLVANGTLVFTPRIPEYEKIFTENEVVYFDNLEELNRKIDFYLSNEKTRQKIAEAGYKRAHTAYNSTIITNFMLEVIFDLPYSQDYGWKNEVIR